MHGDIFYPTFLLRMVLPTDVAMTWGFIVHLFLAGLFTFGFLRAYAGTHFSGGDALPLAGGCGRGGGWKHLVDAFHRYARGSDADGRHL